MADLLTRYYTDCAPQHSWVAEQDGQVSGYVLGCQDSRRYRRVMARRIIPQAIVAAIGRGLLCSPDAWRFAVAGVATVWRGGVACRIPLAAYPAHLHINLRQGCRGRGLGRQLVEAFTTALTQAGVSGVHALVRGDNPPACAFFERQGFHLLGTRTIVMPEAGAWRAHDTRVYGRRLRG